MHDRSISGLVGELGSEVNTLVRQEVALAQSEMNQSIQDLKTAAGSVAAASAVGIAGLVILLLAPSFALGLVLPMWAATLIIGVLTLIVAAVLAATARKKASAANLRPTRTEHTLHRQRDIAEQKARGEHA
jgi:K+-sensing histidine kinase KdpD